MSANRWLSEPLGDHHDRASFSCGVESLDRYFHTQVGQDQRRDLARAYVLVDASGGNISGYYTLNSYSIAASRLPESRDTRRLPRYESFPAILIGRLALARAYQGQGLGGTLLFDALHRCLTLSRQLGSIAVAVDAKDDRARSFYEHYGFISLVDAPNSLILMMSTIARMFPITTTP